MKFRQSIYMTFLLYSLTMSAQSNALDLLNQPAKMSSLATNSVLLSITSAGDRLVAVGERGFILSSEDNGKNWQQSQVPVSVTLTKVSFINDKTGWAIGHGGVVLKSEDAGNSWTKIFDGAVAAQIELQAANAENDFSRASKWRLKEAQNLVSSGPDKPFLDLYFFDENKGLIVGAYGLVFATSDGGLTWRSLIGHVPNQFGMHLYNIHPVDGSVYLVGERGVVFKGDQQLINFEKIETPYKGSFFGMINSINNDLILFGLRGNILRLANDNPDWQHSTMPQPVALTAGIKLSGGELILVDETGQVLLSTDNGSNFTLLNVPQFPGLTSVTEASDGTLVMTSVRGTRRLDLDAITLGAK